MSPSQEKLIVLFFIQISAMLLIAVIFGHLMRRIKQPAVLGELLGGLVLGPSVLGMLWPQLSHALFPGEPMLISWREALVRLGILFFMFSAGSEVNLALMRRKLFQVALTSLTGVMVPFFLGFAAVLVYPVFWAETLPHGRLILALFVGTALSISALPIIARILYDLQLLHTKMGIFIVTAATVSDLIGWSFFIVILTLLENHVLGFQIVVTLLLVFLGIIFLVTGGRYLTAGLLRMSHWFEDWSHGFVTLSIVLMLVMAILAESIGIHAILGAFLAGLAMGPRTSRPQKQAHDTLSNIAIGLFAPLYFVSVGLKTNFVKYFDLPLVLTVLVIATLGKIGGIFLGARWSGIPARESLSIAFGMNARGAMEIVLASAALEYRLIDQRLFVALVVMALITSLASGPAIAKLRQKKSKVLF